MNNSLAGVARTAGGLGLAAATVLGVGLVTSSTASAQDDNRNFFVCKFVTTPDGNEQLQTGMNPISVSENAIPVDDPQPGDEFSDGQSRSVVLEEDIGQVPEPDAEDCEQFLNPPPTTTTEGDDTTTTEGDDTTTTEGDDTTTTGGDNTLPPTGPGDTAAVAAAAAALLTAAGGALLLVRRRAA